MVARMGCMHGQCKRSTCGDMGIRLATGGVVAEFPWLPPGGVAQGLLLPECVRAGCCG